jgi:hypothetical protein
MGISDKCSRCHRRVAATKELPEGCQLRHLAALTLPWIMEALKLSDTNDREIELGRVLRGNASSPGFVDDWRGEHALEGGDVRELTQMLLKTKSEDVTIAMLSAPCRHFVGSEER